MKLLLDTNIFLEVIFNQRQALIARVLLNSVSHELFISDFSLHSIGAQLIRRRGAKRWRRFLEELILPGHVTVLALSGAKLLDVGDVAQRFGLDFDDAYQYVTAEENNLILVSFDKDFDKTTRGRQTPQAITQLSAANNQTSKDQQ
jgi:hypothetical protein